MEELVAQLQDYYAQKTLESQIIIGLLILVVILLFILLLRGSKKKTTRMTATSDFDTSDMAMVLDRLRSATQEAQEALVFLEKEVSNKNDLIVEREEKLQDLYNKTIEREHIASEMGIDTSEEGDLPIVEEDEVPQKNGGGFGKFLLGLIFGGAIVAGVMYTMANLEEVTTLINSFIK